MTKTKRALTLAAATAVVSATAMVPANAAEARHHRPHQQVTSVKGTANFTNLPTHDRVFIDATGISDDGAGTFQIRSDAGRAEGKIICVTGSRATPGFTDAAIGVHINRSTIAGLPRGTDAIEYVRDGGRHNPDFSGLVIGTANCPTAGFTIPTGALTQVPNTHSGTHHRHHARNTGYQVKIQH